MICLWEKLSRDEISNIDKANTIVLLPLASTEQHGAHLPVGTDSIILEKLIDKFIDNSACDDFNILFAPILKIGKSNEHMGHAGTLTFSTQTYYSLLYDIATSIVKSGFKKLVLFNSHGGNTDMLNMISRDIRIDLGIDVFVFDWWFTPFWSDGLKGIQESGKYGVFHAGELETSLMLEVCPESVNMDLAVDEMPNKLNDDNDYITIVGPYTAGWKTNDITKSGVIGSPTFATKEKGKLLYEYAVKKIDKILKEIVKINYSIK